MRRRRPQLLEEHTFTGGTIARTLARARPEAISTRISYASTDNEYFHGTVPTQHGFVLVDRWRTKTRFQLILAGALYIRVDYEPLHRRAICARAGAFARRAAELHGPVRA